MGAEPIPHDLLLAHAGFLRRLAGDLLCDPASADDAVQEVLLRALERPPRDASNLRTWLRRVLTNFVRTRARNDSRRAARELDHGTERESAPSAEQQSALRSVTDAVLALEEPLRTTVLQHYFQGVTTSEIAEREHLPVSTVKSRLQRALEILRVRLKHTNGDSWHTALLALTVPSKIGKGVILVSLKTKLALMGACLIAGWFLYRGYTSSPPTPLPLASSDLDASAAPTRESPPIPALDAATNSRERTAPTPGADERSGAKSAEPSDTLLYGSILDPSGAPWRGLLYEWVMIDDASGQSRRIDAQVDGTYAVHGLPFGSCWVRVDGDDLLGVEKRIELSRDQPHMKCDFTLAPAPRLKVKITTPEGENFYDALKRAREKDEAFGSLDFPFPVATLGPVEELFNEGFPQANGVNGVGWFWSWGPKVKSLPKEYVGVLCIL